MGKILKRGKASIEHKLDDLIKIDKVQIKHKRWTENEISFLRENYNIHTSREIAKLLNTKYNSVRGKIRQLKLHK